MGVATSASALWALGRESVMLTSVREVIVARLSDRYSAELVVAQLRDAGIVARVTSRVEPAWTTGSPTSVMPVEVRVAEERAAEAKRILDEAQREGDEDSER